MPIAEIDGVELFYHEEGQGETLLLIPGLGFDHQYYRFVTPLFAERYRVCAIDPRGIGASTKSPPPYTVEGWADDFVKAIPKIAEGPVHLLGTSLGGAMALAVAEAAPHLVKSLTVVGAFSELDRHATINFALRSKLIDRLGLGEEVATYMGLWTMSRTFLNTDEGYERLQANLKLISLNDPVLYKSFVDSALHWGRALPGQEGTPKFTTRLDRIKAPTLVIGSGNDPLIGLALPQKITDHIEGARLVVMEEGGHIPFIEQPEASSHIVMDFLAGL